MEAGDIEGPGEAPTIWPGLRVSLVDCGTAEHQQRDREHQPANQHRLATAAGGVTRSEGHTSEQASGDEGPENHSVLLRCGVGAL